MRIYEVKSNGVTIEFTPVLAEAMEVFEKSPSSFKALYLLETNGIKRRIR